MIVVLILIFAILIVIVLSVMNSLWDCVRNRSCEDDRWRLIEISQHCWRFLLRFRAGNVLLREFESTSLR
jgi:hypothetical protein